MICVVFEEKTIQTCGAGFCHLAVHKTFQGLLPVGFIGSKKIDHKSEAVFIRNVYKICVFCYVPS